MPIQGTGDTDTWAGVAPVFSVTCASIAGSTAGIGLPYIGVSSVLSPARTDGARLLPDHSED